MSMFDIERMTTSKPLTKQQFEDWTKHALSEFPKEACAYIVQGKIVPVQNVHQEPTEQFSVSLDDRLACESLGHIEGFLHTHCHTPQQAGNVFYPTYWPSTPDMVGWLSDDTRWGISACDGEVVTPPVWMDEDYVAPLNGRFFIHGIHDCYAAVRDWFRVKKGITLKNYPRGMEWWNQGQDLYIEQFKDAGFVEISASEVVPGDCALLAINSKGIISHAVVIEENNMMYHHTFSRTGETLSGSEPFGRWAKHIAKYVRYIGND